MQRIVTRGIRSLKRRFDTLAFVFVGASCLLPGSGSAQFEKPPVLTAREVLPENLRKGPFHEVSSQVTSDGYFNNYHVTSPFGEFDVEGQQFLELRIGEIHALAELDKLSSSKVFQDSVIASGKATLLAPVNAVKKVAETVSDPDKIVETAQMIPEGAEKLFSWAYRQAKGVAHAASDLVSSDGESSKDGEKGSMLETSSNAAKAGKDFGLKYLGYTKRERDLFRRLQVNPYSSNRTLQNEVIRVCTIGTAVGFAFKFVPGLGILGELSTFNRWYSRAEQLSLYEDPDVIREKSKSEMRAMDVPDAIAEEFQKHPAYNPWTRRFITSSLTSLGDSVSGRALFIRAALQAKNEPTSLYFVSVADHLERRGKEQSFKRIVSSLYVPAVVTSNRVLYVPLSVDYLFWTSEVAGIFDDFKKRVTLEEKFASVEVHVRGKVSPRARQALVKLGAKVTEGSW